ncbi:ribbon-helix-helix protein, CopG family [Lactococcus garvieae]|uniref:ribbon-helix-helix protein, CopG family n=1 Tax=Lactococcus garvieae TaxID=1363 RepID=UPI0005A88D47|nr:ribbon-helix-helix protein, CopG family [Lactococcus garvieae]MDG6191164.1 ribbon-helix-helix protein, CopG family [Lactococcus garvieae]
MTEQAKKKKGRPMVGNKPRDRRFELRIDEDSLNRLDEEKKRTGKTRAQIIIELIKKLDD